MDVSKRLVLVVDNNTDSVRAGSCQYCRRCNRYTHACARRYGVDYHGYIIFECDKAVEAGIEVIVLYKSTVVNKSKCSGTVKNRKICSDVV